MLENASLIGRSANLALPAMVPTYVGHLLSLGLLETGPEDPDMKVDYEVLMAESMVLQAIKTASRGPLAAKVDKQLVQVLHECPVAAETSRKSERFMPAATAASVICFLSASRSALERRARS